MTDAYKLYEIQQSLFARNRDNIKPGLERIYAAARKIGNPQYSYKTVHVAGTNGKGSTASMIAKGLIASGERVGLFTSPHIVFFGERFSINAETVQAKKWLEIYGEFENLCEKYELTFFEISTLIAFELFRRENCSWAVLETGMGGRLDSTNVCAPQASVITTIGIDHTMYLGNTIQEIANEKLGIAKSGVPLVISGINEKKIIEQAQNYCKEKNANCIVSNLSRIRNVANSENPPEICLDLKNIYKIAMNGEFQKVNFILAVTVLETLGINMSRQICESVAKTTVSARFQKTQFRGKTLILDVAHNPQAMENFTNSLKKEELKPPVCAILGMMSDKDTKETVKFIAPVADSIFCFTPLTKRAEPADYLAQTLREISTKNVSVCKTATEALEKSLEAGETILVSGSFYTVSQIMIAANV